MVFQRSLLKSMHKISLSGPDITQTEIDAVNQVMRSGRLSLGPELEAFEKAMASYMGTRDAVAVSSGTAGLHCVIKALGIGEGDEVITSPFSFIASANSILFERAKPVFVDIDPRNYSMNADLIEAKITSRTKAILAVHLIGVPCQMDKIQALADKHKLLIIEDACEAIGGQWAGRKLGAIGRAGVFAFYPNKQMTTGEGGMIVTDDPELARVCRSLRNQGRSAHDGYVFERLGYNYRMSDIQAVLGRVQLSRLAEMLEKRRQAAEGYAEELKNCSEIILPPGLGDARTSWFIFL
ncbi:MAG: DegT/DnrJ/EryC1/StrS family aminotransferase, partial [Candidatus Omnitrophica bacterium]|nr:DegT/DnrJ/EryC1/StrS family aminotransferase [Candidatus Omnitrophota bacterium]